MVKVSNNSSKRKKKTTAKERSGNTWKIGLYVIFVARFITKPPHWFEEKSWKPNQHIGQHSRDHSHSSQLEGREFTDPIGLISENTPEVHAGWLVPQAMCQIGEIETPKDLGEH